MAQKLLYLCFIVVKPLSDCIKFPSYKDILGV